MKMARGRRSAGDRGFVGQASGRGRRDQNQAKTRRSRGRQLRELPRSGHPAAIKPRAAVAPEAPGNVSMTGQAMRPTMPFKSAANVVSLDITNNRLVPNAMNRRGDRGILTSRRALYALHTRKSQSPACAVAFYNIAAGAQAAVVAPMSRGFAKNLHLP